MKFSADLYFDFPALLDCFQAIKRSKTWLKIVLLSLFTIGSKNTQFIRHGFLLLNPPVAFAKQIAQPVKQPRAHIGIPFVIAGANLVQVETN